MSQLAGFGILLLFTMALAFPTGPCTAGESGVLLDRVTQSIGFDGSGVQTFQLDVDQADSPLTSPSIAPAAGQNSNIETVHIVCMEGCLSHLEYREQFTDVPISAFLPFDNSSDLITLWGRGGGYVIRIYLVTKTSITKILDEGSASVPVIEDDTYGDLVVTLFQPAMANRPDIQRWEWNGEKSRMTLCNQVGLLTRQMPGNVGREKK